MAAELPPEIQQLIDNGRSLLDSLEQAIKEKMEQMSASDETEDARKTIDSLEEKLEDKNEQIAKLKEELADLRASKLSAKVAAIPNGSASPSPKRSGHARERSHRRSRSRRRNRSRDSRESSREQSRARSGKGRSGGKGEGKAKLCIPYIIGDCMQGNRCPDRHPDPENCREARNSLKQKPCKFGGECRRNDCIFIHEGRDRQRGRDGRDRDAAASAASEKMCRYGSHCKRSDCYFRHP
eukprot:TRINITY_DN106721_c0_g1_i1.p1 TRINITY_DN106721_c0_g1~~TRINITY_DN106721_c0_g1_i1.p1  ORF type:complete len:239 (+),score=39.73 TRINITY_DN106721_c0_g1_i1:53-769(+)